MTLKHPDIMTRPDPVKKEHAIAEALREYRRAGLEPARHTIPLKDRFFSQWKGFAYGVAASLLIVWTFLPQGAVLPHANPENELAVLREMQTLFGNQLQGVVLQGNNIQPVLSAGEVGFTQSQPILITLQQGDKTKHILCFSGNMMTITLQDKEFIINAYVDGKGNVVVEGQDFLWSQGKTLGNTPAQLEARTLGTSL